MKTKLLILLALFAFSTSLSAQLPRFRNPIVAPLWFNPGFAGMNEQQRVTLAYRNEYPGLVDFSTHTLYASYDQLSQRLKGAIGAEVWHDILDRIITTQVSGIYSPKISLGSNWTFSPALKVGFQRNAYRIDDLVFGLPPEILYLQHYGLNLSPGILLNSSNFYVGVASDYLLYSLLQDETFGLVNPLRPPRNWKFQTGYRFQPRGNPRWSLAATGLFAIYRYSFLFNGQLIYNRKWLVLGAGGNIGSYEGPMFTAGVKHERFRLLGVYSRKIGSLGGTSLSDSFELSLMLYFGGKKTVAAQSGSSIRK